MDLISSASSVIEFKSSTLIMDWPTRTKMFYDVFAGIGTLLAGIGAVFGISYWGVKLWRRDKKIRQLRKLFPRRNLNKEFKLVNRGAEGWIFILEERAKLRHWVANPETITDLGFSYSDAAPISEAEILKYEEGEGFDTKL